MHKSFFIFFFSVVCSGCTYSISEYEKMVISAALVEVANRREAVETSEHFDSCEESCTCDFSTGEQSYKQVQKELTVYEIRLPVACESGDKVRICQEIERWVHVSLGPITRDIAECAEFSTNVKTTDPLIVSVENQSNLDHRIVQEERYHYDQPPEDDEPARNSRSSGAIIDFNEKEEDRLKVQRPLIEAEFKKPWREKSVRAVLKKYEQLSVDEFEDLFIVSRVPKHMRTPRDFDEILSADLYFIFSHVELLPISAFRSFLLRFPRCKQMLEEMKMHIETRGCLLTRIRNMRSFGSIDPVYAITRIIDDFLLDIQKCKPAAQIWRENQLHIDKEREEKCILMVLNQRRQRVQLQSLVEMYANDQASYKELRKTALQASLKNDFLLYAYNPIVSYAAKNVIRQYALDNSFYLLQRGTLIQTCMQTELVALLDNIDQKHLNHLLSAAEQELYTTIVRSIDIANNCTIDGFIAEATQWADVAHMVFDYACAFGKGIGHSAYTIASSIANLEDTFITATVGTMCITYLAGCAIKSCLTTTMQMIVDPHVRVAKAYELSDSLRKAGDFIKDTYNATASPIIIEKGTALAADFYITGTLIGVVYAWQKAARSQEVVQAVAEFTVEGVLPESLELIIDEVGNCVSECSQSVSNKIETTEQSLICSEKALTQNITTPIVEATGLSYAQDVIQHVSNSRSVNSVWSKIKPTQELWPTSLVPKSFEIDIAGIKLWVSPNATKHLKEQLCLPPEIMSGLPWNRISFSLEARETLYAHELMFEDFFAMLQQAVNEKVPHFQRLVIKGWELEIRDSRINNGLPSVIHARKVTK